MKKLISLFICVLFAFPAAVHAAEKPDISAQSYVLYCPQSGSVILSENAEKRMKPASTTKLMTTLLTLEAAQRKNTALTFTREMSAEGSSMYLKYGEKLRLSDLAVGMMMCSGNDAANAAALTIGKSSEKFAALMNKRAKQLGMKNTHFVTPSGLDDDNHYSTALDLALLMAAGLKNKAFRELTAQKSAKVSFINPKDKTVSYNNHNKLLRLDPRCIGGKTGYTQAAGRCLVSAASENGVTLICVTLNDRDDWNDHIALYDYGFSNISAYTPEKINLKIPCVGGVTDIVNAVCGNAEPILLGADESKRVKRKIVTESFLYAPVKKGGTVGSVEYYLDGRLLKSYKLTAENDIETEKVKTSFWQKIKELFNYG